MYEMFNTLSEAVNNNGNVKLSLTFLYDYTIEVFIKDNYGNLLVHDTIDLHSDSSILRRKFDTISNILCD